MKKKTFTLIIFQLLMCLGVMAEDVLIVKAVGTKAELPLSDEPTIVIGENVVVKAGAKVLTYGGEQRVTLITHSDFATSKSGDVNADGDVNIADVMAIYNVMAKKATNPTADVNADGDVNIADVMAVYNIMAGKGAPSTTKYYYYAGWECPRNEEELAKLVENSGKESIDNPGYPTSFGVTKTSNTGFTAAQPFAKMTIEIDDSDYVVSHNYTARHSYLIVPNNMGVYDADDVTVSQIGPSFTQDSSVNIPNHIVYKSNEVMDMCAKMIVYNK